MPTLSEYLLIILSTPNFSLYNSAIRGGEKLMGWEWSQTDSPQRAAWINKASSKFRNLLVQRFKKIWEKYPIDALHLDGSHLVVNDANGLIEGLNSAQGNALMHLELAEAMPGVVFGGEHLHEVTFFRESFRPTLETSARSNPASDQRVSIFSLYSTLRLSWTPFF